MLSSSRTSSPEHADRPYSWILQSILQVSASRWRKALTSPALPWHLQTASGFIESIFLLYSWIHWVSWLVGCFEALTPSVSPGRPWPRLTAADSRRIVYWSFHLGLQLIGQLLQPHRTFVEGSWSLFPLAQAVFLGHCSRLKAFEEWQRRFWALPEPSCSIRKDTCYRCLACWDSTRILCWSLWFCQPQKPLTAKFYFQLPISRCPSLIC